MRPSDCVNLTASQIDNLKVEKEKELQQAQAQLHEVELKELELSKQIIILQGQKKDFQISICKARQIVRTLALDIKILISEFWQAKDSR